MNLASHYARALFALMEEKPESATYLRNLTATLKRRGHTRLLPRIFNEYTKLVQAKERITEHTKVTPEKERNRILLELYRKLITTA